MNCETSQIMPDIQSGVPGFEPVWSLPASVRAWQTTRGLGKLPYGGFNLGTHVGDDSARVAANRQQLLPLIPAQPLWLDQVHGTQVLELTTETTTGPIKADAVMTRIPGKVCAVMTADCLPVLITDKAGRVVGAAHAGWRGLAGGVLETLVNRMCECIQCAPSDILAWLGPSIGPDAFEVGDDVLQVFETLDSTNRAYFKQAVAGKWLADLPALACAKLQAMGVKDVTQSGLCTYTQTARFYSYRRDQVTGRMASMIWIDS